MSGKRNIRACKVNHAVNDWVNAVISCISAETRFEQVTIFYVATIQCWTLIILLSKLSLNLWSSFILIVLEFLKHSWIMHLVVRLINKILEKDHSFWDITARNLVERSPFQARFTESHPRRQVNIITPRNSKLTCILYSPRQINRLSF